MMSRLEIEAALRELGWYKYRNKWTKRGPILTAEQRQLFKQVSLRAAAAWECLTASESLG